MDGLNNVVPKLIAVVSMVALFVAGLAILSNMQNKDVESKLTSKQSELWKVIRHERKKDEVSLLQSARNLDEVYELAKLI